MNPPDQPLTSEPPVLVDRLDPISAPGAPVLKKGQIKELRGVWLTNVDSQVLSSKENIEAAFQFLAEAGFTTVYPVVWNRGYTLFPSPVAKRTFGIAVSPDPQFSGVDGKRDMLQECIEAGRKYNLEVIPWFEYGLKVPENHPFFRTRPNLFTQTKTGLKTRTDGISIGYLNPAEAEVKQFLLELMGDVVQRYPVAGVQIDDHFSLWHEFGYDTRTSNLFKQATGQNPPSNSKDPAWVQFRADIITKLIRELATAMRSKRQGLVFSASSHTFPWSLENHLQDWPNWLDQGSVDEFILQNYHADFKKFQSEFENSTLVAKQTQSVAQATHTAPSQYTTSSRTSANSMAMGILSGIRTRQVTADEIKTRVQYARSKGYGVSFFFYESLLQIRPTHEAWEQRAALYKELFAIPSYARTED